MRGKPELVVMRNLFCTAAVLMFLSSFTGCAAGSCLSYGHSCWGAHGKRSGSNIRPLDNYALPSDKRLSYTGDRLLLSRLLNRQIPPLPTKLRARMLAAAADQQPVLMIPQSIEEDQDMLPDIVAVKRSVPEKSSGFEDLIDFSKADHQALSDEIPTDIGLNSDFKDKMINNNNNQKSIAEKTK